MNYSFEQVRNDTTNTLANDITTSLLKFNNKIIPESINGIITGIHMENDKLHNPKGTCINFDCHYKLQDSNDVDSIDMYLWYNQGKLDTEGGSVIFLDMKTPHMYVIY